ncbi:MAG: hypothetical protein SWQ30_13735 [Thermodesulfobacteriota bacterium]|nr:hypothetical protein [Thermodesulfobacteriota bacterium]
MLFTILSHHHKSAAFLEKDLASIADFIDFMRQRDLKSKKLLKLQGILKNYDIALSDLKQFKDRSRKHVDQEFADESITLI